MAFGQVADLGGPIIHLGIDIDGPFAVPRWLERVVPNALEIGWLVAGTRTRNKQIAAELEVEGLELRIGGGGDVL